MFSISQDDVLKALKKSMRLAKQDFLAGAKAEDPPYWTAQAEARRQIYLLLTKDVHENGVEAAYRRASRSYAALPLFHSHGEDQRPDPVISGQERAFEMFFSILGVSPMKRAHLKNARRRVRPDNHIGARSARDDKAKARLSIKLDASLPSS